MSWELVYAHDANGNKVSGDKNLLTDAQCLWVRHGNVYAQNTSHVSVQFHGDVLKFKDDAYWWMIVADTNGNIDMSRWSVGQHTAKGHTSDRWAMKWFVG